MDNTQHSFNLNLRKDLSVNENFLHFAAFGFMLSASLFSAAENDIFSKIEDGYDELESLAKIVDMDASQLEKLIVFCCAMGLLKKKGSKYVNTNLSKDLLVKGSYANILPVLHHYKKHVYGPFGYLTESLREGRNYCHKLDFSGGQEGSEFYEVLTHEPNEYSQFLRAMNNFSKGVGIAISKELKFDEINSIVDFGCGGGVVSAEIAQQHPELEFTLVDIGEALNTAMNTFEQMGVRNKAIFVAGDIYDTTLLPDDAYDAVMVSAVLGDWDEGDQHIILSNALRILKPSGMLIVSETLLDDDGNGPLLPAIMSLYVLLLTKGGKNHSAASIKDIITKAGFCGVYVSDMKQRGLRDLIVARKPN